MKKLILLLILCPSFASPLLAVYQYYYSDNLTSINPNNWVQNGSVTVNYGGLTSGTLISTVPVPVDSQSVKNAVFANSIDFKWQNSQMAAKCGGELETRAGCRGKPVYWRGSLDAGRRHGICKTIQSGTDPRYLWQRYSTKAI
jgi:hypothetical protein